jgi:hypothetical protein
VIEKRADYARASGYTEEALRVFDMANIIINAPKRGP